MEITVHRPYDAPDPATGRRVLVDGLWPRGVRKDDDRYDEWLPDVAPSAELRRWYGHEEDRFEEFVDRYGQELDQNPAVARLLAEDGRIVLLTATRDVDRSHAAVLARYLLDRDGG